MSVQRSQTLPATLVGAISNRQEASQHYPPRTEVIENSGPKPEFRVSGSTSKNTPESKGATSVSRAHKLCRNLGLESWYFLHERLRGRHVEESRKVAISEDFRSACFASLLHLFPVSVSITLIILNWRGYYIGAELAGPSGEDSLKFLGLQLAAKMLELLSMASLSCILFALVRHQLLVDALPFGAVTAGFEFSKLSLLWSKEYIATCAAKFGSIRAKILLITTITTFTLLGAVIGPAAAVAALPNVRDWPAGGTHFYLNATPDNLYPVFLNKMESWKVSCTSETKLGCFPSNYVALVEEIFSYWPSSQSTALELDTTPVMPENTLLSGQRSLHRLAMRFGGPFIFNPQVTVATTPTSVISDAISELAKLWAIANTQLCATGNVPSYCYYSDITYSVDTSQPATFVKCNSNSVGQSLRFPRLDQPFRQYPLVQYDNDSLSSTEWFRNSTTNGTVPGLEWVELPATFGNSSISAVVALPRDNATTQDDRILACTIDARWANVTVTASFLSGPKIVSGLPKDWFTTGRHSRNLKGQYTWPQVKITPAWAQNLNPIIEEPNLSTFAGLSNSIGRVGDISATAESLSAVEAILAVMLTEGLSRVGNAALILGTLKSPGTDGWMKEFLPQGQVFGTGGAAFNYTPIPDDHSAEFEVKTTVKGYGYGTTTATILSISILLIYSFIALSYVVYTICFSKTSSGTWESITELLALGLNSTVPSQLENVSAGISSLETLEKKVAIRANETRLELMFEQDEMTTESFKTAVEYGKAYS